MNKIYFLLLTVLIFSCKSKDQQTDDDVYDRFKAEITEDSLNILAKSDAQFVADYHYDVSKQKEAKEWLSKLDSYIKVEDEKIKNDKIADQLFLSRNLKIVKTFHKDEECNFLQQHILVSSYSDNKDTLTKAVKILTDSIWSSIPFSNNCIKNVRCGVYLYKKAKDFELNGWRNWFIMATKISDGEAEVRFGS